MKIPSSVVIALIFIFPSIAKAAIISGSVTGLLSPGVEITFDETILISNGPISNEYDSFGVNFQNAFYDVQGFTVPTGRHIANFTVGTTNPFLGITFNNDVSDAAFLLLTNPGQTTFEAYLDGALISSFVAGTSLEQAFFGFTNLQFDELRIFPGGSGNFGRFDNLQFNSISDVPVPAALPLFLVGLASLGLVRRKKNQAIRPKKQFTRV